MPLLTSLGGEESSGPPRSLGRDGSNATASSSVCVFGQCHDKRERRVFEEQPGRVAETKTGGMREAHRLRPSALLKHAKGWQNMPSVFHPHPFDLLPSRYRSSRGGINGHVCVGRNAGRRPKLQIASLATAASTRHGRGLLN